MKKLKMLVFCFLFICIAIYMCALLNQRRYHAQYEYNEDVRSILYNDTVYNQWIDVSEQYIIKGNIYDDQMYPYFFIDSFYREYKKKIYVSKQDFFGDLRNPFEYMLIGDSSFDVYSNFLIELPDDWDRIFVKNGFIFPTTTNNIINEVWMSLDEDSTENIKSQKMVDRIVECAKSDGKIELDKEIVDYIKKYSADHHCLWLKYEGYPLVEEFHIEETEDGRYIVDQYTPEEYDTIYWEEEAHQ